MHVVAEVWNNEVVLCHSALREVRGQLRKGPDVRDAVRRVGIEVVGNVIKVDERIVADRVGELLDQRACRTIDTLEIAFPGNAEVLEAGNQMIGCAYGFRGWGPVGPDSDRPARLHPKVNRKAAGIPMRLVVSFGVSADGEQRPVDVRCERAALH